VKYLSDFFRNKIKITEAQYRIIKK